MTIIEIVESERPAFAGFQPWLALLLLAVPVTSAFTGFGVQLAASRASFSKYLPLVLSALITVVGLSIHLRIQYGWDGFKKLANKKYLLCLIPGPFGAAKYALQNASVTMMSSSLFFVMMRTSLLWVAILDAVRAKQLPDVLQTITLLAVLLSCISSMLQALEETEDGAETTPILAVVLAAACGLADALCLGPT